MIPCRFPKQSPLYSIEISSLEKKKKECHREKQNVMSSASTSSFFFSYNSFSSLFSPPTFFCTVIADAFDKLFADPKPKAQMKAIFLQAICQRKITGKKLCCGQSFISPELTLRIAKGWYKICFVQ